MRSVPLISFHFMTGVSVPVTSKEHKEMSKNISQRWRGALWNSREAETRAEPGLASLPGFEEEQLAFLGSGGPGWLPKGSV